MKSPDQWVITQEMTSANLRYGNVPKTTRHPRALKNSLNSIWLLLLLTLLPLSFKNWSYWKMKLEFFFKIVNSVLTEHHRLGSMVLRNITATYWFRANLRRYNVQKSDILKKQKENQFQYIFFRRIIQVIDVVLFDSYQSLHVMIGYLSMPNKTLYWFQYLLDTGSSGFPPEIAFKGGR